MGGLGELHVRVHMCTNTTPLLFLASFILHPFSPLLLVVLHAVKGVIISGYLYAHRHLTSPFSNQHACICTMYMYMHVYIYPIHTHAHTHTPFSPYMYI